MSLSIMISGQLSKAPEQRTSARGSSYTVATLRSGEGDDAVFASITAFGDLAGTLAGLERGSPITVVGTGKIGTYEPKDGSGTRASLSITASRIVCLTDRQAAPKARGQRKPADRQPYQSAGPREFAPGDFDDSIPF